MPPVDATNDPHAPTMKYIDVLPERSGARLALEWLPNLNNEFSSLAGYVVLTGKRDRTAYSVTEFPVSWDGRGFMLTKIGGTGTDKTSSGYAVFIDTAVAARSQCECRGFCKGAFCKHLDACLTLISNKWL